MEAKKPKTAAKAPKKAKTEKKAAKATKKTDSLKQPKKAVILSFRRGRHTQRTNQFLLDIAGCDTKAKAARFIGRKVVWKSPGKKEIVGKITAPHGNSGTVRARFQKGLPGTALTQKVRLQ
jgi:large subunit ribosomal protein L35Ae